jgi:hypothetical protein
MAILQRMTIAFLTVAMLATGAVRAASTTNFSDNWYTESQAGWGMFVQQHADVLFIGLFVYGADNKPTWFTAAASYQSNSATEHVVFTGDLYLTNGTYYGATWNPAALGYSKVGTLTFDATAANEVTLTYTVDGTQVVKNVTRLTWRYENLSGKYSGSWINDYDSCGPNNHDESIMIDIVHNADNTIMFSFSSGGGWWFDLYGTYSQSGHIGKIVGSVDYPGTWYFTFSDIEKSTAGFTGRIDAVTRYFSGNVMNTCVTTNGRIAVARQ